MATWTGYSDGTISRTPASPCIGASHKTTIRQLSLLDIGSNYETTRIGIISFLHRVRRDARFYSGSPEPHRQSAPGLLGAAFQRQLRGERSTDQARAQWQGAVQTGLFLRLRGGAATHGQRHRGGRVESPHREARLTQDRAAPAHKRVFHD